MSEPSLVIYTCVVGRYDGSLLPAVASPNITYVCFTDEPGALTAPGWEMRPLQSPARLKSGHDINRYHKLFPHRLFPEHRWSVYIDGNVLYDGGFASLVAAAQEAQVAMAAFLHPLDHSLTKEIEICGFTKFDDRDRAVAPQQLAMAREAGVDTEAVILTNCVLVRDHQHPALPAAMSLWWSHLFEFSKRDQVSLPYVLATTGLPVLTLDDAGFDRMAVTRRDHAPLPLTKRVKRRIARLLQAR